jgi:phosphoribosylanthranilate isomerase
MVRVKICGVTTPAEAAFATECGADMIGLNFYAKSPRAISGVLAATIVRELRESAVAVGVFVGTPDEDVKTSVQNLGLRGVQTYSDAPTSCEFRPAVHFAAFRVMGEPCLHAIRRFVSGAGVGRVPDAVLVDAHVPGEFGGTGQRAPWDLLAGFDPGAPLILAGGLTPDNVAEAIRIVRPWAVDVASGVESAPGKKDPGKVRAFIQAAKAAGL